MRLTSVDTGNIFKDSAMTLEIRKRTNQVARGAATQHHTTEYLLLKPSHGLLRKRWNVTPKASATTSTSSDFNGETSSRRVRHSHVVDPLLLAVVSQVRYYIDRSDIPCNYAYSAFALPDPLAHLDGRHAQVTWGG